MKKAKELKQILDEKEITGAMMVYKPMNAKETKIVAEWVAKQKAKYASKKNKISVSQTP